MSCRLNKFLIFIFLIFYSNNIVFSQSDRKDFIIKWNTKLEIDKTDNERLTNKKQFFLNFDGAVYNDPETYLPSFTGKIPVGNYNPDNDYLLEIENQVFEKLQPDNILGVLIPDELQNKIELKYQLTYERKKPFIVYSFKPLRKNINTSEYEKLLSVSLRIVRKIKPASKLKNDKSQLKQYTTTSVLSSGFWYKIRVKESGIYKLTYTQLIDMGFSNPGNVKIFGNGCTSLPVITNGNYTDDLVENAIKPIDGNDGSFDEGDYFIFYGQSPVKWSWNENMQVFDHYVNPYTDYSYYFITEGSEPGLRTIKTESLTGEPDNIVTSFIDCYFIEDNDTSFIKSGREWYGRHFNMDLNNSLNFSFPGLISTEAVKLTSRLVCRSSKHSPNSSFLISSGGNPIQTIIFPGIDLNLFEGRFAIAKKELSEVQVNGEDFGIDIQFNKSIGTSEGWLDYLTLNYKRRLELNTNQMIFRDANSSIQGNISEFRITTLSDNYFVWDISNPIQPGEILGNKNGNIFSFRTQTEDLKQFIIFSSDLNTLLSPEIEGPNLGEVQHQNLHEKAQPDLIIVCNSILEDYAEELGEFHRNTDGMDVLVVNQEEVFNEFSSGAPDVVAIRDFVKMFYDRATNEDEMPKYLLLYGDGSYDNKTYSDNNSNLILTYQSVESLDPIDSYVTDDYFGLLDGGEELTFGLLDIGVGRMPVKDLQQANVVNQKIFHYASDNSLGDWRNVISFIADDEDGNTHMRDANSIALNIETNFPVFNVEKIYLDAYPQVSTSGGQFYPAVNSAINHRMKKGALIFNYIGHGSETGLAHERILGISDIKKWANYDKMPLFMTATCEFSRFDDKKNVSAGEWVLLNSKGGGIALFSTTRLVFSSGNRRLNEELFKHIFKSDEKGERYKLGDILRMTKNGSGNDTNKLNFTLLGDPALTLAYPEHNIKTTSINGKDITNITDTLRAFSQVSVSGYVEDTKGNKLSDFNGIVYPTVFDKPVNMTNLSNDGTSIMEFDVMNSIIYKGKASIINGEFSFSFIVPKDISYKYGFGKLSYYGDNKDIDASGKETRLIIGGSLETTGDDNFGPQINLYMNDDNFVFGGTTNENPSLVAHVSDSNGINTTGNGIGHDITAILDDDDKNTYVLNDFYEGELDNFRNGIVKFPLTDLEIGTHKLKFKIWDTYNNSSEDYIEFVVTGSDELTIDHVLNYPNPFSNHTSFYFEHNQPNVDLDVLIQVLTVSGKLVKSFEFISDAGSQVNSNSFRVGPVEWDGLDDFGDRIGRGTYIYRIKVRDNFGHIVEKYQKLVII